MIRTLLGFGLLLCVCLLVLPLAVGLWDGLTGASEGLTLALTERRAGLLWRGLKLALIGGGLAQVLGAFLAVGWMRPRPRWLFMLATALALGTLLTPSYILAYALSLLILPQGLAVSAYQEQPWFWWLATEGRAMIGMAIWQAPIAGVILALGWKQTGVTLARLGSLDAGFATLLLRVVAPALLPWVMASWLATTLLLLGEFSLPHLALVQTYNTELLAEAQAHPGRALLLAWPLLLVLAGFAGAVWWMRGWLQRRWREHDALEEMPGRLWVPTGVRVVLVLLAAAVLLGPWWLLVSQLSDVAALWQTGALYPAHWPHAAQIAVYAGLLAVLMGVTLEALLWMRSSWYGRGVVMLLALLWAALLLVPPVLVGDLALVTFGPQRWLSDRLLIVGVVTAMRYGVLALLVLLLAGRGQQRSLHELGQMDRADALQIWWQVRLPLLRPACVGGFVLVGVLAMTDVAASQLVVPPGTASLAMTMLNEIHNGRNANVVALCLQTLAVVWLIAAGVAWQLGRASRR